MSPHISILSASLRMLILASCMGALLSAADSAKDDSMPAIITGSPFSVQMRREMTASATNPAGPLDLGGDILVGLALTDPPGTRTVHLVHAAAMAKTDTGMPLEMRTGDGAGPRIEPEKNTEEDTGCGWWFSFNLPPAPMGSTTITMSFAADLLVADAALHTTDIIDFTAAQHQLPGWPAPLQLTRNEAGDLIISWTEECHVKHMFGSGVDLLDTSQREIDSGEPNSYMAGKVVMYSVRYAQGVLAGATLRIKSHQNLRQIPVAAGPITFHIPR